MQVTLIRRRCQSLILALAVARGMVFGAERSQVKVKRLKSALVYDRPAWICVWNERRPHLNLSIVAIHHAIILTSRHK